ncbi:unnamed protein product [Nesidiocoris tenuis]|uniref:Uncharacterized protein n=1 Tax=Nesidiocoris tenuis TaxID=355587 RepID=A0A6H5GLG9_9HEMI|nr:unnamed protein product [Nesidiocoris tenuis]
MTPYLSNLRRKMRLLPKPSRSPCRSQAKEVSPQLNLSVKRSSVQEVWQFPGRWRQPSLAFPELKIWYSSLKKYLALETSLVTRTAFTIRSRSKAVHPQLQPVRGRINFTKGGRHFEQLSIAGVEPLHQRARRTKITFSCLANFQAPVVFVVGLVGLSVAYPRTYQEQRQIYYTQPLPVQLGPYQIPQQAQVLQYQLPASTSFLPNNVPGVRYGQQQVVYVVPGGSQVLFEEGSTGGQGNSPYLESFMNFLNGHLPSAVRPGQQAPEKPAEKPDKVEEKPIENAPEEQSASVEEPQKPQQQQVELLNPQQLNGQQSAQQQQLQQYPVLHQQSPLLHQQSALPFAPLAPQDQQLLQQRFYLLNQQQQQPQQLFGRPSIAGPSANFLLNYRTYPLMILMCSRTLNSSSQTAGRFSRWSRRSRRCRSRRHGHRRAWRHGVVCTYGHCRRRNQAQTRR